MRRSRVLCGIVTMVSLAASCGPGGGDDDTTPPGGGIAGGGVTGDALAGSLEVHVTDVRTHEPLAGATVTVVEPAATGTSSAEGVVTLSDAALSGSVTVSASADGYAAATWVGVTRSEMTIPLMPFAAPASATVSGTIQGWSELPAPSDFNEYNLGLVLASFTDDLAAEENQLDQPTQENRPLNTCLKTALEDSCAWSLVARTGRQLHYAVLVRGNSQGTFEDLSDDTYTLLGYAVGDAVTLAAGQQMSGVQLTRVEATVPLQVDFPTAPSGLDRLYAFPMLDLGEAGRMVVPVPPVTPAQRSIMLPAATGPLAGGAVEIAVTANAPGTSEYPFSTSFARNGGTPGPLPAPPSNVSAAGTVSFAPMAGASLHFAEIRDTGDRVIWNGVILDGSTSFALPAGVGAGRLSVTGTEMSGFDPGDFTLPEVTAGFTSAAGAATP